MMNQTSKQTCRQCGREYISYCAACSALTDDPDHVDPHADDVDVDTFKGVRAFVDPATAFKAQRAESFEVVMVDDNGSPVVSMCEYDGADVVQYGDEVMTAEQLAKAHARTLAWDRRERFAVRKHVVETLLVVQP